MIRRFQNKLSRLCEKKKRVAIVYHNGHKNEARRSPQL